MGNIPFAFCVQPLMVNHSFASSDWEWVSYQLVGANSSGTTTVRSYQHELISHLSFEQGALVHFTESLAGSETCECESSGALIEDAYTGFYNSNHPMDSSRIMRC